MKNLKESLFYNYVLYLIEKLKVYCFFEVLEPLSLDSMKNEKVVYLKFRESFTKVKNMNKLRWSGFIYLLGSNDLKSFCVILQNLIKSTPNIIFYHICFEGTRMVLGDFLLLFINKFIFYFRIIKMLTFWSVIIGYYSVLVRKLTGVVLLKACQQ